MGRAREAVRQPLGGPPSLCTMPSDAHTAAGFDLYNGWWVTAVPGSSIGAAQNSTAGEYTRRRPPRPWRRPFGPVRTPRVPVAVRLPVNKASSSPPPTPPPSLPAGGPNWSVRGTGGAPPGRCKKARAAPLATDRWWRTTTRDVEMWCGGRRRCWLVVASMGRDEVAGRADKVGTVRWPGWCPVVDLASTPSALLRMVCLVVCSRTAVVCSERSADLPFRGARRGSGGGKLSRPDGRASGTDVTCCL